MQEPSVFTKIVRGEIPCHKVYEDDLTLAFIPLHPTTNGHVLVIPKTQVDQFIDLEPTDYQAVMATVQKVGRRLRDVMHPKRVGLKIVGLDVPHVHVHVLAFDTSEDYHRIADESASVDHDMLAAMAAKLVF